MVALAASLREKGLAETSISSEDEREAAIHAAFWVMRDAAWERAVSSASEMREVREYGAVALPVTNEEVELVLQLAPPHDDSVLAVSTHMQLLQDFDIEADSFGGTRGTPSAFRRLVRGSRSPRVLAEAAAQMFYTRERYHQTRSWDAIKEAKLGVIERLGELHNANLLDDEGSDRSLRDDSKALIERIVDEDRHNIAIMEAARRVAEESDAVLRREAFASDKRYEPSEFPAAWVIEAVMNGYRSQHESMPSDVGAWLLGQDGCPESILVAEAWDPDNAHRVAQHRNASKETRAIAAATMSAQSPEPVHYNEARPCERLTGTQVPCGNTFRNGFDGDWCGRCAGYPGTLAGSLGGHIPLGGRPHAEGRRVAYLRESLRLGQKESQEEMQARLTTLRSRLGEPTGRVVSLEDMASGFIVDITSPKEFLDAGEDLIKFASKDRDRPAINCVGMPTLNKRRVLAATDHHSLAIDFRAAAPAAGIVGAAGTDPVLHPAVLSGARKQGAVLKGCHVAGDMMLYELEQDGEITLNGDYDSFKFPKIDPLFVPSRRYSPLPVDTTTGKLRADFKDGAHIEVSVEGLEQLVAQVKSAEMARRRDHKPHKDTRKVAGIVFRSHGGQEPVVGGMCSQYDDERPKAMVDIDGRLRASSYITRIGDDPYAVSETCIQAKYIDKMIKMAKRRGSSTLKFGVRFQPGAGHIAPVWCEVAEGLGVLQMPVRTS